MTDEKIHEVIAVLKKYFEDREIPKWRFPADSELHSHRHRLAHLHWMCDEMEKFLVEGRREKLMRWLGFVQGALWAHGDFTIEALKKMNKPGGGTCEK